MADTALNTAKSSIARTIGLSVIALTAVMALPPQAQAQSADQCSHRGQLDTQYCDENKDLVADLPKDPKKWRDPSALVWAYTPVEDPAIYANVFKPFTDFRMGQIAGHDDGAGQRKAGFDRMFRQGRQNLLHRLAKIDVDD